MITRIGVLVSAFLLTVSATADANKAISVQGYDSNGYPVFETFSNAALDAPGQYGVTKIAQWGDPLTPPQTRTRCISEAWGKWPWGEEWRTCNGWATDYRTMQVEVYMKGVGPDDVSAAAKDILETTIRTCVGLASVVAVNALWATPSPEPAARIAAAYAGGAATFTGCISGKAATLTAVGVTVGAIQLAFHQNAGWSKWSNE